MLLLFTVTINICYEKPPSILNDPVRLSYLFSRVLLLQWLSLIFLWFVPFCSLYNDSFIELSDFHRWTALARSTNSSAFKYIQRGKQRHNCFSAFVFQSRQMINRTHSTNTKNTNVYFVLFLFFVRSHRLADNIMMIT